MNAHCHDNFEPRTLEEEVVAHLHGTDEVMRMREDIAAIDLVIDAGRRSGNVLLAVGRKYHRGHPLRRFALNRACNLELAAQA